MENYSQNTNGPNVMKLLVYRLNDIDEGSLFEISKFVEDTQISRPIEKLSYLIMVQEDLKQLFDWSVSWQIILDIDKCSVMYAGKWL